MGTFLRFAGGGLTHDPRAVQLRSNAPKLAGRWWLYLLLGLAAVALGVLLLLDVFTAIRTLAVLAGLSLLVTGLLDLFSVDRFPSRWLGVVSGAVFVGAGLLALAWPDATLWAVAVVAGAGMLTGGVLRSIGAVGNRDVEGWGFVLVGGVLSVVAGVLALVWPRATLLVLGILLGVRTFLLGVLEVSFAIALRRLRNERA